MFDPKIAREWPSEGGKDEILQWIAERRGQGVLKLMPKEKPKLEGEANGAPIAG